MHFIFVTSVYNAEDQTHETTRLDGAPQASAWREYHTSYGFEVTIDKAKRQMWEQGKAEIELARQNLANLVPSTIDPTPSTLQNALFETIMGPNSKMEKLLRSELAPFSRVEYCRFMASFFTSCQFSTSLKAIHSSSRFNSTPLMDLKTYNTIWRRIANDA
jgi:hypothetical protein